MQCEGAWKMQWSRDTRRPITDPCLENLILVSLLAEAMTTGNAGCAELLLLWKDCSGAATTAKLGTAVLFCGNTLCSIHELRSFALS